MRKAIAILMTIAGIAACFASTADARDKIAMLHYDVGIPLGETEGYIDETSWRGLGFDYRSFRNRGRNLAVGFSFAWQVFDKSTDELITITQDNFTADIKGLQRRYLNAFPFMISFDWYSSQDPRNSRFFIGTGVGTYYMIQRIEIGVQAIEENSWHFGLMPEVGVNVPYGDVELMAMARYNYAFAAGTSIDGDGKTWDYVTVTVGVAWSRW